MADIVNLRRARKAKARADADRTAAANRAAFGRTAQDKASAREAAERAERALDGARRETD